VHFKSLVFLAQFLHVCGEFLHGFYKVNSKFLFGGAKT
jgi:hypothetical protein